MSQFLEYRIYEFTILRASKSKVKKSKKVTKLVGLKNGGLVGPSNLITFAGT
jgi:hypothetical protein